MNLIVIAALIAVSGAAKLDRTYLPPASAQTAGGSPGAIQAPFGASFRSQGNQGLGGIPKGAYSNDFGGVVVDAAAAGTRAAGPDESGLGAPRPSYGFQASKVGDAAFRGSQVAGFRQFPSQQGEDDSVNAATNGNLGVPGFDNRNGNQGGRFQASSVASVGQEPSQFDKPSFNAEQVEAERSNAEQDRGAAILRYDSEVGPESYSYSFETDNGISAEENGVAADGVQAQGGFSYTGDDGQVYSVTYTADENGYQPKGDHLPTPPPIPEAILKSLEQNAKEEAAGLNDDGSYDAQKYNVGSDYNESHNNNAQYNRGQSNKASENGVTVSAETTSEFVNEHSAPSFKQSQNLNNNYDSQKFAQNGQISNAFGNNGGFSSADIQKSSGNSAYAVASQSPENVEGSLGHSFQGQQKYGQRLGSQPNVDGNIFGQQSVGQGAEFNANSNNLGPQTQDQSSRLPNLALSNTPNRIHTTQAPIAKFATHSSGNQYGQRMQQQVGFGGQYSSGKDYFNQDTNSQANFGQQKQTQTPAFDVPSNQREASDYEPQFAQSQASFGIQTNNIKSDQQTAPEASKFDKQNFGYLPPRRNDMTIPQNPPTSRVPEEISSHSQFQSIPQDVTDSTSDLRPTKQPDTSLTTPFETPNLGIATQHTPSQNEQFTRNDQGSSLNGKFSQMSAEPQQPKNSFSRRPSNQGFSQFSQKSGSRPQGPSYRQQNIPVAKGPTNPQGSASAFGALNSQESDATKDNFSDGNEEQTTGVAYTDSAPTTETSERFDQSQDQFNQNSQGQFNQVFQNPNRPISQFSANPQKPFSQNDFPNQHTSHNGQDDSYYYKQPSKPFVVPETSQNKFYRVIDQPTLNSQSSAQFSYSQQGQLGSNPNFQSQQSSTKYPRPPTLPAVAPTSAVNTESEIPQFTKGVTQASASSFASNLPLAEFNGNTQRFPQRQQYSQMAQSFSRPQYQSSVQQTPAIPSPSSEQNQYDQNSNGFNQFSGTQTFGQRLPNNQQFSQQKPGDESITDVPASSYESEIYQYNKPADAFPAPSQDPTPQGSEQTPVKFEPTKIEQDAPSQGQLQHKRHPFGMNVDERGQFNQQSPQFASASASFGLNGNTASSVAGKGEVFGGPRSPPSFDEETGYHY